MIDYERLLISLKDVILEDHWNNYDFETIIGAAQPCWDQTAILVKSTDFEAVFDCMSYECMSFDSYDLTE